MNDRILPVDETLSKTGYKARNSLHNAVEKHGFPEPVQVGPNRIGWWESEVDEWLKARPRGYLAPVAQPRETEAA